MESSTQVLLDKMAEQALLQRLNDDAQAWRPRLQLAHLYRRQGRLADVRRLFTQHDVISPPSAEYDYVAALFAGRCPPPMARQETLPTPFRRIREFLPRSLYVQLRQALLDQRERLQPSCYLTRESGYQTVSCDHSVRNSYEMPLNAVLRDAYLAQMQTEIPRSLEVFGMAPFVIDRYEVKYLAYSDGGHFGCHYDNQGINHTRTLTFLLYLGQDAPHYRGGEVLLYDRGDEAGRYTRIAPEHNSLLIFPSDAMHEVLPVVLPDGDLSEGRFAVVSWLHRQA